MGEVISLDNYRAHKIGYLAALKIETIRDNRGDMAALNRYPVHWWQSSRRPYTDMSLHYYDGNGWVKLE